MKARYASLLALSFLVAACGPQAPEEQDAGASARSVVVQLVQPQPLEVQIKFPVLIQPKETLELRASASGKITTLDYRQGDIVPAGGVPPAGWLDIDEYLTNQPEGAVKPTEEQIVLRNLRHLKDFQCFARTDDTQLRQQFREAQANYDQATRDLRRAEEYAQSTGSQLDQARTRRNVARAAAERVRSMIEDTYVCNPMEGVLTERMHQVGEYVNTGELIGEVAVMDRLVAELEIPEAHRQALKLGQKMQVRIDSIKDDGGRTVTREAVVVRIASVAHAQTHSFTVELELPNHDLKLPAGVFGTVNVTIYSRPDALVVPLTALRLNGSTKSLFVLPASGGNTVQELKDIELGQFSAEWVEIRGDKLKPGMRVVTFGAQMLGDGDEVSWTDKDPYVVENDGELSP